ncbi:MAG: Stk1 family PASTA domain-containing Ser/Thr kinase [Solirubrobacteraceae bacterium]
MAEIAPGTMIDGRYRVLSRLGSGGMADVFLAEDQQLGRKVALKLLHRRFSEDPGFVERFRREAQAAAGLQHPNVVGVYDRGDYDGTYYIAMEHLTGRSLKQLIRDEAPIDPIRAVDITLQILKAARFAHRHGVIHRDLKPHNAIVDESDHVKVTDFGIARAGASDMTETGSIMGTAQYLSPEQAQGHAVSESSDLYSVGVILYELLTGRVPFDAESAVTIALKHVSEAPTAPTQVNPSVPPALEEVVLWTLNKNPADRPRNADDLITALEAARAAILAGAAGERTAAMAAVAGGAGLAAGLPSAAAPPAGMAAAPTAPPPVLAGPSADGQGDPPPGEPGPEDAEEARWRKWWPWLALALVLLVAGGAAAFYFVTKPTKVPVPNVVGYRLNTARTVLQNAGFEVSVIQVPSKKSVGLVIGELPQGGSKVDEGAKISLTVSSGPGSVPVPSEVVGETLDQAKKTLRAAGLKVGHVFTQSSTQFVEGRVITTGPQPGQLVQVESRVNLFVSSGPPKVSIPDVTGESEGQAKSDLHNAGFNDITTATQTSSSAPGTVLSQSPSGGSQVVPSSTTVNLVIAKAIPKAPVPDVTGQGASAATSQLRQAGFSVVERSKTVAHQNKDGVVVRQDPPGGTSVKPGSTVTIVVGHYSAPTPTTPTTPTTTTSTTPTTPTTPGP